MALVTANLTRVIKVSDAQVMMISGTQDLTPYAPKANPTFTGTVTLPSTTSIGNVSATELGYLDGVTSAIQTQLNAKANSASLATVATSGDYADLLNKPTLGTAAAKDVGQAAGNVLELSEDATIEVGSGDYGSGKVRVYNSGTGTFGQITFGGISWDLNGDIDGSTKGIVSIIPPTSAGIQAVLGFGANTAGCAYTFLPYSGTVAHTAEVKSANFTAANDGEYTITATCTVTDPTPEQGKGYTVFVRNGTVTMGSDSFGTAGTTIKRIYHSGAWANYSGTGSVAVGDITGLGTGVATALAVNVGSSGAFVTLGGALGTPLSGTVTNLTGTASININGTVGATTPTTGAFTTLNASGLTRIGTATTADATSDVLIGTSATTQTGLTIQGRASQTANLLRIVESSNNAANNGWRFDASAVTFATAGNVGYLNSTTFIGQPSFVFKWSSSGTNPFAAETASIRRGTGSPEGVVTAQIGSLYLRTDGGAGTTLYVKESGTGNTGWVAK